MPGLLIGVRHGMPLFYKKMMVAFNSLCFQAPMQCKLWDNRVQAIMNSVYSIRFLSQVPIAFFPLSLQCVWWSWSCWPSPYVFTFSTDLSSATSREPNTNWTVTVHRPLFGSWMFRWSPSQLPGTATDPPEITTAWALDVFIKITHPIANVPTGHKRQTQMWKRIQKARPRENTRRGEEQITNVWVLCFLFS